uniref:Reverse transcriptase zinc-binding domain-containing protein n=1 Tax=Cannabis sativa TaxID=3483 RepID=A0A803Q7V2_CANSA
MGVNPVSSPLDHMVHGKGLASASGVKRPSFISQQAVVGGSFRSQLKRVRASDREEDSSSASTNLEHVDSWCDLFPNAVLHHLSFYGSDHRVLKLILNDNGPNSSLRSKRHFHFENVWLENPEFFFVVKTTWDSEIYWRQRARTHWLKAGDKNTKFFRRFASQRKKNNTIKFLRDDRDNIVSDHDAIYNLVVSYFSDLFCSKGCDAEATNLILDCLGLPLEDLDCAFLDEPFSVKEIRRALFNLSRDKVPGLDGLNAYFYQKNWSTLVFDFANAVFSCLIEEIVHAINSRKSGKTGWAALKLDMAKTFDRVDWHYLESVMFHFNFPPRVKLFNSDNVPPSPFLSYFINSSGAWDVSKLNNCFSETLVNEILSVPILGLQDKDDIIWGHDSSGVFSVKYAYHLAFSHQDIPHSSSFTNSKKFWSKIWTSKIPPKVKVFVWRMFSNAIPVAFSLHKNVLLILLCVLYVRFNLKLSSMLIRLLQIEESLEVIKQVTVSSSAPNMDPPALQELPTEISFQIFTDATIDTN